MAGTLSVADEPRIFRGWWVLLGLFVVLTAGSGFAFYAQGVFLDALVNEQGFSVSMAGAGTGFFFVVSGIGGYYSGGLISRFDIRAVMTVGATVATVGIVLLGQVRTEWQMFAVFLIYGAGYSLAGLVPATSLVTRWFHVRRSIALSIASTGLSVGGIAITPFLAQVIDRRSLADSATDIAIAYWLTVVPVTLLLLRPSPEALGLRPDGAAAVGDEPAPAPIGVPFAVAVRTRFFRLQSAAFILVMGAQVGALQHLFKLTKDAVDLDAANLALIVVTTTSVGARLVGGLAASRFSLLTITSILIVVQATGIAIIGTTEQRWIILGGVFVLGTAMGNLLMLHPLLLADAYGVVDYPRIYGLGSLLMITGVGLGPFLVGLTRDLASYRVAFFAAAGIALLGLVLFRAAGRPDKRWDDGPDEGEVATPEAAPVLVADAAPSIDDLVDDGELSPLLLAAGSPAGRQPAPSADFVPPQTAEQTRRSTGSSVGPGTGDDQARLDPGPVDSLTSDRTGKPPFDLGTRTVELGTRSRRRPDPTTTNGSPDNGPADDGTASDVTTAHDADPAHDDGRENDDGGSHTAGQPNDDGRAGGDAAEAGGAAAVGAGEIRTATMLTAGNGTAASDGATSEADDTAPAEIGATSEADARAAGRDGGDGPEPAKTWVRRLGAAGSVAVTFGLVVWLRGRSTRGGAAQPGP